MVSYRESPVSDVAAAALLDAYFASRALTFPASMGEYRPVLPSDADFRSPRGVFIVGSENGIDVACGGIRHVDHVAGVTRFEVKHVWVAPEARGRGVGTDLLDELEQRARTFGASEVVLDTNVAQEAATRLYERSGYISIPAYNANPNATHWFAKNLTTELE